MGSLGYDEHVEEIMIGSSAAPNNYSSTSALPLLSLNHVSYVCKSVADSVRFYVDVLGFVLIKRPSSFKFEGAWLFNYGIGIHLLECDNLQRRKGRINTKDNHISFQCCDMKLVIKKLEKMGIEYVTAQVEEGGIMVDQMFFHDPDGHMVEICNCDNLPVLPLSPCPLKKLSKDTTTKVSSTAIYGKQGSELHCANELEAQMMETLMMDLINIAY